MSNEKYTAHSEIEHALLEDRAGIYRDSLLTLFNQERMKITKALNHGVKRDEYTALAALLRSIEEATFVVNKMWNNYQNKG